MLTRRRLLLPALLLAHAALLVIAGRERLLAAQPSVKSIVMTEIVAAAPRDLPIEVKLLPVVAAVDAPELTVAVAADTLPSVAAAQTESGCNLSDAVQTRLRSSAQVATALQLIPRQSRSVADAMMLWDGHWIDAGAIGGSAALEPIRAAVAAAIRAAPADCRRATISGPRLLIIASAAGNQILAFGSGQWTWAQLLDG